MSIATAAWGMSRNMPHEVYVNNYNKLLTDTGLGGLQVQYKKEEKKNDKKEEGKKEEKMKKAHSPKIRRVTISEQKEEDEDKVKWKEKEKGCKVL